MQLFRQLLVAPAAIGLLAPLAAVDSPAAHAAELNNSVPDYADTKEQVTSINQFSDVYPTDCLPGSGQPDRALRLCRRLPQRHPPWQPG